MRDTSPLHSGDLLLLEINHPLPLRLFVTRRGRRVLIPAHFDHDLPQPTSVIGFSGRRLQKNTIVGDLSVRESQLNVFNLLGLGVPRDWF